MEKLTLDSEIFRRGIADLITREELGSLLAKGRPLRIKHGIDATSPDLHLGHAASLWKLRRLQEAGHRAVLLLGDFTTAIGDPTGRVKTRPQLSHREITRNITSIAAHAKKILLPDPRLLEIRKSSEWYGKMKAGDLVRLLSMVTHARLIERDMFQKRLENHVEIYAHELIYPILQGYDSVVLKSDLTLIGSDQLFNEHLGRFFQEKFGQPPQAIIALKILPGLDGGEKMSKSLGNYIALGDSPWEKFGKAMRLLDSLIIPYLEAYTAVSPKEIEETEQNLKSGKNPMEAKLFFAEALVRRYHGSGEAAKARERFLKIFSQKELAEIPEVSLEHGSYAPLQLLLQLKLVGSKSEARRLIGQGAVEINKSVLSDPRARIEIRGGETIRVGKRRFARIR